MTDWAAEGAVLVEREAGESCHRCAGVQCELWRWPDKEFHWFYCPCCGCRIRTSDQIEATAQEHMAELGMDEQQYTEHTRSFIDPSPLPPEALAGLRATIEKNEAEWTPACEHETENPWAKS